MEVGKELGVIGGHAQANLGSSYKPPSQIQYLYSDLVQTGIDFSLP